MVYVFAFVLTVCLITSKFFLYFIVEEKEEVNMEVNVAVHSLSLTLNKPEYELVLATVSNVACKVNTFSD